MLVLAHRGFHESVPENTLQAFAAAIAEGVDGIETDVRVSADGAAVLMHDRVAPDGVPVTERSRRQLEAVLGHAVPTLAEALDLDRDILWNVEIKTAAGWLAARPTLLAARATHRLLISSFHAPLALEAARAGLDAAVLTASRPPSAESLLAGLRGEDRLRSIVWDYEVLDAALLHRCRELGFEHYVYGAATADEVRACREAAVRGVILDRPQLAR